MRIAGIDASGRELRLVVLDRTPLRTRFAGAARAVSPPDADPAGLGRAIHDVLLSQGLGGATAVIGMGSESAMLRRVVFPFASAGKIARVLRLELESSLPGPLSALAMSCVPAGQEGEARPARSLFSGRSGRHAFLAAAAPRDIVDRRREALASLDPEVLDLDLSGLWHAALAADAAAERPDASGGVGAILSGLFPRREGAAETGPLLALDAGPDRALFALCVGGRPRRARHAPLAGLSPGGGDWRAELARQTLLTLAAEAGFGPARVLLTGASAAPELAAELEAGLKSGPGAGLCREVRCLTDLGRVLFPGQDKAAGLGGDMAVACGLALRGVGTGGFNFLDDDPAGTSLVREALGLSGRPGQSRRTAFLAAGALMAVVAYGADAFLDIRFKKAWLARLDGELTSLAAQAAPGTRKGMEPSQYVSVVKDRLRELEASWPARMRSGVGGGLTQLLRTVSRAIPEGSPVVVGEFTVDGRRVRMTATADAYETVESVRARLLESGAFASVDIKGATTKPGGTGVEFELEMTAADGGAGS
jgi:hypothetical protein